MADNLGHERENRRDKVRNWTSQGSPIVTNAGGIDGLVIQEFDCHISLSGQVCITKKVKLNLDLFEREFLLLAADYYLKQYKSVSGQKMSQQIVKRRILQSKKWIESNHSYGDGSNFPLYSELNFKINFGHVFMGYPSLRFAQKLPSTFSQQIKITTA